MKKILFGLIFISSMIFAGVTDIEATPRFIKKTKLKIIDIRTDSEWVKHGIIRDAFLLTFFDRFGSYDIDAFTKKLDKIIEKYYLICVLSGRLAQLVQSTCLTSRGSEVRVLSPEPFNSTILSVCH